MLRCLDCGEPMYDDMADERGVVRCDCGLKYVTTFLRGANPQRWEEARLTRAFIRHGSTLTLNDSSVVGV